MHASFVSLLPFAAVIPLALLTRQVLIGLLAGLAVGAYLLDPAPIAGVATALAYVYRELAVPGNLHLIVFLWAFGALVGTMRAAGGVTGFAEWLAPRIRSDRSAFAVIWMSSLATFMAPDFRIITVGPVMRHMAARFHIEPERLAYAIEVTSTPLIALIPVGTAFVGYMVGLLTVSLRHAGHADSAFPFFLSTIPFNFFAIAILPVGFYLSFRRGRGDEARRPPEDREICAGEQHAARLEPSPAQRDHTPDARPDALNLVMPIGLLVAFTFFLIWWDGHLHSVTPSGWLVHADAARAMSEAVLITLVATGVWYAVRRLSVARIMEGVLEGGNEMMPVILLLALVWAVSGEAADLGFVPYVSRTLGNALPSVFIAPGLFVIGSVMSYFIGSTFGTWGILMPLGFSLAQSAHASLPLVAGAVFASGTLGGFASPLSDNTVAMATVLRLNPLRFARTLVKTTLLAGGAATVGYAVAGLWG